MADSFSQFAQGAGQYLHKSFGARLKDTGYLIKHSFTLFGRDTDLKKPTIGMIMFVLFNRLLAWAAIFSLAFDYPNWFPSTLVLLFVLFILVPLRILYDVRKRANQSWIAYNVLTGKDISYADAKRHTSKEGPRLGFIGFVDILVRYSRRQRSGRKGLIGVLINLAIAAIAEVWDLLGNWMIPAVVIEQRPLKEIVPQIKAIRANVPAALAGVFGYDFAGNVLKTLVGQIYSIAIILALVIGYYFPENLPLVWSTRIQGTNNFVDISYFPLLVVLCFGSLLGGIFVKLVESLKAVYFTIFYVSIMRPNEIIPEIRSEVTNYLLMQEKGTVQR